MWSDRFQLDDSTSGRFYGRWIDIYLLKQGLDKVVINLTDFSARERRAVFMHLRQLDAGERARIILQRRRP